MLRWCIYITLAYCSTVVPLHAEEEKVDFNRDIRPILSNRCFTCHGPDPETREAELRLDLVEAATEDRGGYRAVTPGQPEKSDMLRRVIEEGDEQMPPQESGERLTKAEVDLLRRWIAQGAEYATHWSFDPPVRREPPKVTDQQRVRNAIDRYVLARLEKRGLGFSPEANRYTLIRRVSLDLTGVPPTPEEVDRFVNDKDPKAYENLVERSLKSPAYGERWAAMWLDLARYADSAGYANDPPRTIWMYRDWVIRAFNNNKPFDEFTIEQLAGDMLENASDSQRIATAFHRNTLTNSEGGTNDEEFRNVAVVDRVNTTMQVWMGITIRCAQCHNHKYDPLSQEEYFRIFAFLNNTADADRADESPVLGVYADQQREQRAKLQKQIDELKKQLTPSDTELRKRLATWESSYRKPTWRYVAPTKMSSAGGATLSLHDENIVVAAGPRPETDVYQLEFEGGQEPIAAVRLEALPDKALPSGGPGRAEGGNFVLSELDLSAGPLRKAREGRFVRVELPGKARILHLAEVQVFSGNDNVAPQGKASQSSTGFGGPAKLANDGNTNGEYTAKSVSHTATGDPNTWWEVDLGDSVPVDRIVVWNRTDNNLQSRLDGYVVSLLDAKRNPVWTQRNAKAPKRESVAAVGGLSPVVWSNTSESYAQAKSGDNPYGAWSAAAAIDKDAKGVKWGWAVGGAPGVANAAAFVAQSDIRFDGAARFKLTLKQNYGASHTLGRFRVSVAAGPRPIQLLPTNVQKILQLAGKDRDEQQQQELLDYFRSIDKPSKTLLDKIAAIEKRMAAIKTITTPIMVELPKDKRRTTKIQIRGNFMVTSDAVTEGTPEALHAFPKDAPKTRLEFAKWLVAKTNPLTARVVVNRYWEQLFGVGIVATSEEFGTQGDLPSHPLVLDHLALDLMDSGWDVKQLLRTIVLSSTYRQSSAVSVDLDSKDPENRWFARGPRFRLSAEMIRDQALRAAGLLSDRMYGPSVRPPRPKLGLKAAFGGSTDWETSPGEDRFRRALYTSWRRSLPYPSMATFDAPTRNVCTIRRGRTNTPLQALVTLNDPVYVEAAQALARRITALDATDSASRAAYGFRLAACRPPSDDETAKLAALFERVKRKLAATPEQAKLLATEPLGPVTGAEAQKADYAELAAWTAVANVLLNLDEVLVKH